MPRPGNSEAGERSFVSRSELFPTFPGVPETINAPSHHFFTIGTEFAPIDG